MQRDHVNLRIEVDRQTDLDFGAWADDEGRSKRRHLAILTRKLTALRKTNPDDLVRLGLLDRPLALK